MREDEWVSECVEEMSEVMSQAVVHLLSEGGVRFALGVHLFTCSR